jgi:nucleotide-binding universal stress UspA family protein
VYASVLVALDGSEPAAEAIPHGLAIARRFGACLILLRVVSRFDDTALGAMADPKVPDMNWEVLSRREYDSRRSQAEGYLQALTRSLKADGERIRPCIAEGEAAAAILETAKSLARPLVVTTPYGRTAALKRSRTGELGGVAAAVLCGATVPVLVVRS